jgi:VIT1/CCC1 family predicted Fe2+/Mn2+ transporter
MPIPALIAPLLAQGLGLISNAVLAKGKEWVEEKTGVKLDQPLSAEDTLKLRQYEMQHEEELLRLRIEDKKLDLTDVQGARDMNTRINESANATWLSKNVPAILALVVIIVGFILLGTTKDADVRTAVVGLMTLVLGYYFGSTSSSRIKDDAIRALSGGDK